MKHSIIKHSNIESSSFSLVAAHRKRKRKSTGITEIENIAMDFPFYCIFFKFAYCCYMFIYGEICLCRKAGIIFIRHPLDLLIMRMLFKNKEKKLRVVTNPTPLYLEQLSPFPELVAGDWPRDVVNDLHFQDVCRAIRHKLLG